MSMTLGATVLSIACTSAALSADMPARNYTKAPAMVGPASNWAGLYVGFNAGGAWGRLSPDYASQNAVTSAAGLAFLQGLANPDMNSSGFTGGGQIGYNYQIQKVVFGVEGDMNYTGLSQTRTNGPFGLPVCGVPTCSIAQSYNADWLATFRGRFGLTTGNFLVYATGGLAVAGVRYSDTLTLPTSVNAGSSSSVRTGWTLGLGAEWTLNPSWSIKAEYLYVDLGSTSYTMTNNLVPAATVVV
ncbi:MAG: outer membrane beta-barrel protein, partial [Pseudolabrys sp.]|nr:outer membrane beta-barrel protein [Pseudolabrys sp.]